MRNHTPTYSQHFQLLKQCMRVFLSWNRDLTVSSISLRISSLDLSASKCYWRVLPVNMIKKARFVSSLEMSAWMYFPRKRMHFCRKLSVVDLLYFLSSLEYDLNNSTILSRHTVRVVSIPGGASPTTWFVRFGMEDGCSSSRYRYILLFLALIYLWTVGFLARVIFRPGYLLLQNVVQGVEDRVVSTF